MSVQGQLERPRLKRCALISTGNENKSDKLTQMFAQYAS